MERSQNQSAEGRVADKPVAQLLVELLRERLSGVLTLKDDRVVRVLHLQAGAVRFAVSNVRSELAGRAQVAAGLISQAAFDRALALAKEQKLAMHEALAAAHVLTPEQLKPALKQQTTEVALGALAMQTGTHQFASKLVEAQGAIPDARVSTVGLVLEWARRSPGDARTMRAWLDTRAQLRVARSTELEKESFALKAIWPGESLTGQLVSGRPLSELLARTSAPELPLLYALASSGLLVLSLSSAKVHPGAPAGAVDEDRHKIFSPQEQETRRMLFGERDRLKHATHYEVLGVGPTATVAEIRAAYLVAVRKFHSDAFSGQELGSARATITELFQRVNEANQALTSATERAEYDVFLDRKAKGLPTDVAVIMQAESLFQKGELLFNAGKFEDAETVFREAIALNRAEAEFYAYLGMTLFRRRGRPQDALPHLEKARSLDPKLASAQVFLAAIQSAQGDDEGARRILRKLLEQDPDNAMAKAEASRIRAKIAAEQTKKPGFFGSLFKKS